MFKFIYNFLFIDQKTQEISHTKFFSIIGYIIMCWSFIFVVYQGTTNIDYMLWALFGGIVIGNRTIKEKLMKNK